MTPQFQNRIGIDDVIQITGGVAAVVVAPGVGLTFGDMTRFGIDEIGSIRIHGVVPAPLGLVENVTGQQGRPLTGFANKIHVPQNQHRRLRVGRKQPCQTLVTDERGNLITFVLPARFVGTAGKVGVDHHRRYPPLTGGIDPRRTVPRQGPGLQNREAADKDAVGLTGTEPVPAAAGAHP